jgi:molybdenum cofactor cytidylyltransferase
MGRPKQLLPWGATSVLGHLIASWGELGAAQVGVVLANGSAVDLELDRLGFGRKERIVNPAPALGMFSSIQCAAQWNGWKKDLTHMVVSLGDQPHLRRETLASLLQFAETHSPAICQPLFDDRGRHPVVLPFPFFQELETEEVRTFREFLAARQNQRLFCPCNDPGLALDLDYPEDYLKALQLLNK